MITTCQCHLCLGGIQFESADFQEKLRTNIAILGQSLPCPHCGKTTTLYLNLKTETNPPAPDNAPTPAGT